jgi:coenzyme F420-reducing hydrogenase gamma subunit
MLEFGLVVPGGVVGVAGLGLQRRAGAHQAFLIIEPVRAVVEVDVDIPGPPVGHLIYDVLEAGEREASAV